jgi:general secretion pathway protein C
MKRLPVIGTFVLFVALCVSAAYWGMQLFKPPVRPVTAPLQTSKAEVRLDAAAALFGGRAASVAVASNFQLKGVILAGNSGESVAILAAEGKPGQAIIVNREVAPGVIVKEVHARYVLLSEGGVTKRVELPDSAKGQAIVDTAGSLPGTAMRTSPAQAGQAVQPGLSMPVTPSVQPSTSSQPVQSNQAPSLAQSPAAPGMQAPPLMQASPPAGTAPPAYTPVPRGASQ